MAEASPKNRRGAAKLPGLSFLSVNSWFGFGGGGSVRIQDSSCGRAEKDANLGHGKEVIPAGRHGIGVPGSFRADQPTDSYVKRSEYFGVVRIYPNVAGDHKRPEADSPGGGIRHRRADPSAQGIRGVQSDPPGDARGPQPGPAARPPDD